MAVETCVYVVVHVNSGPFQRSEMAGWHSAGFFTHNLLVKRGADIAFVQLGEGNFLLTARRCCFCPDCLYANRIVQKALSLPSFPVLMHGNFSG